MPWFAPPRKVHLHIPARRSRTDCADLRQTLCGAHREARRLDGRAAGEPQDCHRNGGNCGRGNALDAAPNVIVVHQCAVIVRGSTGRLVE